jgi:hypothetical protein
MERGSRAESEVVPGARNTRCNFLETRASGCSAQRGVGGVRPLAEG